ncbi:hypothetical protein EV361DRAFT_889300 [Lentinula raphanica]|uniref:Uncharacterized protein n=1 Tax=Lentinula raphanica TaxID=153919 RepID=A0AA38PG77_9AGAR|nr:hypothetical protein F5880DRAFT_1608596 [Lentinula raphanica]KAJ3842349.1 hypothetical protein F5878DRAFT_657683 [Lentinula raphanica]KAJ3975341.1 hypothetical protein EV361DRAFT_889300 [Lentinula raphanica]
MTSVIAPQILSSSLPQSSGHESKTMQPYNELDCLEDAIQTFTQVLAQSGRSAVQLHCSVPTWNTESNSCLDLHDLNHLRSKSLVVIHDLVKSLRSSGIFATYSLVPAHSPLCLVCASSPGFDATRINTRAASLLQNAKLDIGEHVLLANLERCPSLIIC